MKIRDRILVELQAIEMQDDVRVLYACESGSRAWGFPSTDSDYDVRFLYLRPTEWYLTVDLERKRYVIEMPIDDELDINGWDLRKALQLFHKSNPPLLEWLGSPIVYYEKYSAAQRMHDLMPICYSPRACMYHYLHMARGNMREYLKGESVWVKKYFYVLRPLLAVRWLEQELGVVPMTFATLVERVVESSELRRAIWNLIEAKQAGQELDYGPRIPTISDFIERELERLEEQQLHVGIQKCCVDKLNEIFRTVLEEVWRG